MPNVTKLPDVLAGVLTVDSGDGVGNNTVQLASHAFVPQLAWLDACHPL